jgi:hypothetical protein
MAKEIMFDVRAREAILRGVNNASGIAVVEVYALE